MKKRSTTLLAYGLAMMFVLYNCKKKEEPFPLEPDTAIAAELNAITVAPITLVQPAPVTTTAAAVEASAKATAVNSGMANLSSGTVPATVQAAADEVKAVFTAAELTKLEGITTQQLAAVSAGGAVPADLKVLLDKMIANPALQAYLPKLTFPSVNGTTISGGRTGAVESIEKGDGIEVEDACVQAAAAAYDLVKTRLDATKTSELAKVTAAYQAAIAPLAGEEASCTSGVPAKYNPLRTSIQSTLTQALANIEANKDNLPAGLAPLLIAFTKIQWLGVLSLVNNLQAADLKACAEKTKAATAAATAARDANTAAANAAYNTALALAQTKRTQLTQSCHNQGGGK